MRVFTSDDGRSWTAVAVEGKELQNPAEFGWQAVLFRTVEPTPAERIAYRPVGWLAAASAAELREALTGADGVRAHWGGA